MKILENSEIYGVLVKKEEEQFVLFAKELPDDNKLKASSARRVKVR